MKKVIIFMFTLFALIACAKTPTSKPSALTGTSWEGKRYVDIMGDGYRLALTFKDVYSGEISVWMKNDKGVVKKMFDHQPMSYVVVGNKIKYLAQPFSEVQNTLSKDEFLNSAKTMQILHQDDKKLVVTYYNTPVTLERVK